MTRKHHPRSKQRPRATNRLHGLCSLLLCIVSWLALSQTAMARDVRLALLVGHQRGWKGEQPLPWVVSGDLNPMKTALTRIGYHTIALANPTPHQIRYAFRRVKAYTKRYGVTTFLFYYSGHADKRFFHLGPRQRKPLGYGEFLRFFLQLKVKRRFAILDACHGGQVVPLLEGTTIAPNAQRTKPTTPRKSLRTNERIFQFLNQQLPQSRRFANPGELRLWYTLRLPKGVKRPRKAFDFARTPFLRREDGAGIQIIGTIGVAWHDPSMRASLLTAYLLRGLKGAADNVRDGRITVEELYNYAQAMLRHKGQTLNRFSLFNGQYTLAPHYQSGLALASRIRGNIRVSIGQFTWRYHKRDARRIKIPTIPGKGEVKIQYQGQCWRKQMSFPKGQSVELTDYGTKASCRDNTAQRKGSIQLDADTIELPYRPSPHTLSLSIGYSEVGLSSLTVRHPTFALGYRHRFVGTELHYYLGQAPAGKSFLIHRLGLSLHIGAPLFFAPGMGFFIGSFARAGMAMVGLAQGTRIVPSLGLGGIAEFQFPIGQRIGFRIGTELALDYTPTAAISSISFQWKLHSTIFFRL